MPGMNGLEVLHWLRQNYSDRGMAIYLLTSSDDPAHKEQAIAYGTTDYLLKTPYADELIKKLDGLIELTNGHAALVVSEPANPELRACPQD
jgi:CheY-like chemotaxis protein